MVDGSALGGLIGLALIQGLTEFLPVSSSGHLVLFQNLFGLTEPEIFFDVSVHVGTLAAVCVVFFKDLSEMVSALFSISTWYLKEEGLWTSLARKPEMRLMALILAGTVPTVLLGLVFRPMAEKVFASVSFVGGMLLVTGLLLWSSRGALARNPTGVPAARTALLIGIAQARNGDARAGTESTHQLPGPSATADETQVDRLVRTDR